MKKKYIVMLGGVLLLAGAGLGLLFGSIDMNQISRMLEDIPHGLREILMIVLIKSVSEICRYLHFIKCIRIS